MQQIFANGSSSLLTAPINSTATSLTVTAGTGALFPNPVGQYFIATLIDIATGLLKEIVSVTAVSTDTFTIIRAQEGTTARSWLAGDIIQCLMTAGTAANFLQGFLVQGNTNPIYPSLLGGASQEISGIWTCTGVPSNSDGSNGDYCFRSDGSAVNHIYYKSAGIWSALI